MPQIRDLTNDDSIKGNEKLLGTDTDTGTTLNYPISKIKTYIDREANTAAVSDLTNIDVKNSITLPSATTNNNNPDKGFIQFGTNSRPRIYNQSNDTFRVEGASDGNLQLDAPNIALTRSSTYGSLLTAGDSGVSLYYQGSEKFTTTSTGVTVIGALTIDRDKPVRFGQVTLSTASGSTAGGIFTQVFTVTGLTADSIVTATINSGGNGRTIREVEPGTDSLTIRISQVADGAKISYIAIG